MKTGIRVSSGLIVGMMVLLFALAAPRHSVAQYLWWKVEPRGGALQRGDGLTFDIFGKRAAIELLFTFSNEEDDQSWSIPSAFLPAVEVNLRNQTGRIQRTDIQWLGATLFASNGEINVNVGEPLVLAPGERFEVIASIRSSDGDLESGQYRLDVNVQGAARTLRFVSGGQWNRRYEPRGTLNLRIVEPRTADERRKQRVVQGGDALSRQDSMSALRHFGELIRLNPRDLEARAGAAQAYSELGRFREAVAEFEIVLPAIAGRRSGLYVSAAHAYVGIGNEQKAESLLRDHVGAEMVRPLLENMREEVRRVSRTR